MFYKPYIAARESVYRLNVTSYLSVQVVNNTSDLGYHIYKCTGTGNGYEVVQFHFLHSPLLFTAALVTPHHHYSAIPLE